MAKIILVEDEINIASFIERGLREFGHEVSVVYDGNAGWELLQNESFDLLILDIIMPGMNGLELCRMYRQRFGYHSPVVMLTALGTTDDIVKGLDAGADDYLVKPFAFEELLARIRVLLRKSKEAPQTVCKLDDLEVHLDTHQVLRAGHEIKLSGKEFALLRYMIQNTGIVLSRDRLEQHLWNYDYAGGSNVIDVYIRYLRKKIDEGAQTKLIHTVRGAGYVMRAEP